MNNSPYLALSLVPLRDARKPGVKTLCTTKGSMANFAHRAMTIFQDEAIAESRTFLPADSIGAARTSTLQRPRSPEADRATLVADGLTAAELLRASMPLGRRSGQADTRLTAGTAPSGGRCSRWCIHRRRLRGPAPV
jgi:hypothetical protein